MKRKIILIVFLSLLFLGCMPGDGSATPEDPSGFFWGVWHGWIAPLSLIIGFFSDGIRVYETFNTGWWYDLGFYISIIGGFGGVSFARKKRKKGPEC